MSLRGEGEPTLHPQFWDLVDAVRARGLLPYTITNASRVDVARFDRRLPAVGVSLANLQVLLAQIGAAPVVHGVDYGQPLADLLAVVDGLGGVRRGAAAAAQGGLRRH